VQSPQLDSSQGSLVVGERHTPLSQVRPLQQSSSAAQVWLAVRHWHTPEELQVMFPQQSVSAEQLPPPSPQHRVDPDVSRQLSPEQQDEALEQLVPTLPQEGPPGSPVGARHRPRVQTRLPSQRAPVVQQTWLSRPQRDRSSPPPASSQLLEAQDAPPVQALPQ